MEKDAAVSTAVSSPSSTSPHPASLPATVPTACISCRSKHLKCDGQPRCSRCVSQGIECIYLKSRRGYKGKRGPSKNPSSLDGSQNDAEIDVQALAELEALDVPFLPMTNVPHQPTSTNWAAKTSHLRISPEERCIEAYYFYFHDSHPFLPPRHELLRLLKSGSIDHLQTAICFIGSRYLPNSTSISFALKLDSLIASSSSPKDASMVQAMLLFAIGLDGSSDQKKAVEILVKAQNLALELGMNQREYATMHSMGSMIYEESLRRTWWELYVVCVMAAGFHSRRLFNAPNVICTVPVPCEEKDYESGCIPTSYTMEDFDDTLFSSDDIEWSSYTYRIAATRNLEQILRAEIHLFPDDPAIHRLDSHLVNWVLHLPEAKKSYFDQQGNFDEMLFQAHMINNVSTITLHRHSSSLETLALQTITSCSSLPPTHLTHPSTYHTTKTLHASSLLSKLITLPVPLLKHTHFLICALTLSSISHLSYWSALPILAPEQDIKEQIRLNAGALRVLAGVWSSARMGYGQVTVVARKIFERRKERVGEVFWREFMGEEEMEMEGMIEGVGPVGAVEGL